MCPNCGEPVPVNASKPSDDLVVPGEEIIDFSPHVPAGEPSEEAAADAQIGILSEGAYPASPDQAHVVQECSPLREPPSLDGPSAELDVGPAHVLQRGSPPDIQQVIAAIETNFGFLDRRQASENRRVIAESRSNISDPTATSRLARLASMVAKSAVFRQGRHPISQKQIGDAVLLAQFGVACLHGREQQDCQFSLALLTGLAALRRKTIDAATLFERVGSLLKNGGEARLRARWEELLATVTVHLGDPASAGPVDSDEANQWARVIAEHVDRGKWKPALLERFIKTLQSHGVGESIYLDRLVNRAKEGAGRTPPEGTLSFLGPALQNDFRTWVQNSEFDKIRRVLWDNRFSLLQATSRVLVHPSFQTLQPPRQSIYLPFRLLKAFDAAKAGAWSQDKPRQQAAITQFAELSEQSAYPESQVFFQEWHAYAKAVCLGAHSAAQDWSDIQKRLKQYVPFEVIWNLSVFYMRQNRPEQALALLSPGITSLRAPFSHLRFAIYCGIQVLQSKNPENIDVSVLDFMAKNLCHLPISHCYLCWLCLLEVAPSNDLIEQSQKLATFQELEGSPVVVMEPDKVRIDRETLRDIDEFRLYLVRNKLEDTWRLWVNEFAESHRWHTQGWFWLAEACEKAIGHDQSAQDAAEDALRKCVDEQIKLLNKRSSNVELVQGRIRGTLIKLFEFYKRRAVADTKIRKSFDTYYRQARLAPIWDATNTANNKLVALVRQYGDNGDPGPDWRMPPNLANDLGTVQDVEGLRVLRTRVEAFLATCPASPQSVVAQRRDLVDAVVQAVAALASGTSSAAELAERLSQLNRDMEAAQQFVYGESALRCLRPLLAAVGRAFSAFSLAIKGTPVLELGFYPESGGLASDFAETSLVITVTHHGPGAIEDMRISAESEDGTVAFRGDAQVRHIPPDTIEIVGVPVQTSSTQAQGSVQCGVTGSYRWGVIKDLPAKARIDAPWYRFADFIRERGISGYEIPSPFVFDRALHPTRDDPRLFHGREQQLGLVNNTIGRRAPLGSPIYFHGIRRCGKTSLLNKIAAGLDRDLFSPVLFDLHGIRADEQDIAEIVYNLVNKKIVPALVQSTDYGPAAGDLLLSQEQRYPLSELETIFSRIRELSGARQPVFLIDEFHVLAGAGTGRLLDVLRRVYDSHQVWFIFSGLLRPEPLRKLCGKNDLLPLQPREVDFLTMAEATATVRDPIRDYGMVVPESTARRIFAYSAGNPNYVAKVASLALYRAANEGRRVLTPQDIDGVAEVLCDDKANFSSTVLSTQVLSEAEIDAARSLVASMSAHDDSIEKTTAINLVGEDLLAALIDKYVFQLREGRIHTRGLLLLNHLRRLNELSPERRPQRNGTRRKVGLFIDLENTLPHIPASLKMEDFGRRLFAYAEALGEVVGPQVVADPRNLPRAAEYKMKLEGLGYDVSYVPDYMKPKPNLADMMLLEKMDDKLDQWSYELIVLCLGDKDYKFRVDSLLKKGIRVRLVGIPFSRHIGEEYVSLESARRQYCLAEGLDESDFVIDSLALILEDNTAVKAASL